MKNAARDLCVLVTLVLLGPLLSAPAFSQPNRETAQLKKDVEALKEGQASIRRDLEELKELLRGRQAARPAEPPTSILSVSGATFLGDKNAPLTLVEFFDYQCPFCARHVRETLPQIERDYIKTGKLRYVIRDFPIESIHPQAVKAHEAVRCAGEQQKYWDMHALLLANPKALSGNGLEGHAKTLGLDVSNFQLCMDSGRHVAGIRQDQAEGSKVGVNGTPSFFLGLTDPNDSKIKTLRTIRGAQPYGTFQEAIDSLLLLSSRKK